MSPIQPSAFDPKQFISHAGSGKRVVSLQQNQALYSQGDPADAVFYLQDGQMKLTVISSQGKEAVVALLEPDSFLGEACLGGQEVRLESAVAVADATVMRIDKAVMVRVLHDEPALAELFLSYLLSRNMRIQEDLVDHLFNSAEKRLARVLLLLSHFGKAGNSDPVIPKINHETLAEMIGTTRSRVSFFLNKFRKLGFIDYNGDLHVHSSLLNVVLYD